MAEAQGQDTGKGPESQGSNGAGGSDAPADFDAAFAQLSAEMAGTAAPEPAGGEVDAKGTGKPAEGETGASGHPEGTGGLPDPSQVGADGKTKEPEGQQAKEPEGGQPKPEDKPAAQQEPGDKGRLSDTDFLEQFRQIVQGNQPKGEEKPAAQQQDQGPKPYTAEEQELVTAAWKDFPDVMKAAELERSREYQGLVAHIFKEVTGFYKPFMDRLAAVEGTAGKTATDAHTAALYAAVPDYAEVAPKVADWIKAAPAILKPAYEAVAKAGSVQDVTSLIDIWRKETGTAAPAGGQQARSGGAGAAAPAGGQQAQRKGPDPKAVAALAPVATKRTGTDTGGVDLNDFDGAFKIASEEMSRSIAAAR